MINVDDLLKPVSDEKPSGEDFTYHERFIELETAAKGREATQFAEAEEPDWKEVRDKALEVLRESKHLRAGVLLTLSLMKIGGAEGLRDGLAVVKGLTENFWSDVYPRLDPDDNNDPTERLNILSNLSSPKFAFQIQQIVICQSPGLGRITLGQYLAAKDSSRASAADAPKPKDAGPDLNQITAAFRDTNAESIKVTYGFIDESIASAQALETFIDDKLGAGNGVNFETLHKLLKSMKDAVAPYANNGASVAEVSGSDAAESAESTSGSSVRSGGGGGGGGPIASGDDVIKQIDLICDYYRKNEPSSPVPLILLRAKNLVNKDFTSIMSDLTPEALSQLQVITGKTDK